VEDRRCGSCALVSMRDMAAAMGVYERKHRPPTFLHRRLSTMASSPSYWAILVYVAISIFPDVKLGWTQN
jgi:hypothetical protein